MIDYYKIFKDDFDLFNKIIDFFLCEAIDPAQFVENKKILKSNPNYSEFLDLGYLSLEDFLWYYSFTFPKSAGIPTAYVEYGMEALKNHVLIMPMGNYQNNIVPRYKANNDRAKFFYNHKLICNLLFGFPYIVNEYGESVVKIRIYKYGTENIGTGFIIRNDKRKIVVTNKHIFCNKEKFEILDVKDNIIPYMSEPYLSENKDVAFIDVNTEIKNFVLQSHVELLEDIITIGYPSIPCTSEAYQVVHKGEINTFVNNYIDRNNYLIFSAKTSSGNSGSPIIGNHGMVLGMVTEDLFEKEEYQEKGKLPYYSGITSKDIMDELTSYLTGLEYDK